MPLKAVTLLLLLLLLAGCSGTNLFVIDKQDFYEVAAGQTITPERKGFFLSEMYMTKVAEAKVKRMHK